jgi:hypothetical protein
MLLTSRHNNNLLAMIDAPCLCRRVMRFYLTKAQLNSVEAANLGKLAHHYHVWHPQVLEMGRVPDTTLEARQKKGTILTASQLLS